jgi:dipeptidyl aminopeptidase/acylaminoacyl peptidase
MAIVGRLDVDLIVAKRDCVYRNDLLCVWRRGGDGEYSEIGGQELDEGDREFEFFDEDMEVNGIQGVLYGRRDDDMEPSERPLMLMIHGGPHGSAMNTYHPLFYLLAKNGALILNVNYSGSWGRGNKFARSLCGKSWEIEAEEVKCFIDKLVEDKRCDSNQIKVFGGSYGGYIALGLLQKYPDLISHTSIFNPVVNGFSMFVGSTYYNFVLSSMLGEIDGQFKFNRHLTDKECLTIMEKSPVFMDFKFKGQLVMFTGLKDDMVPPLSTRNLFKRLRALGLQVQLYEYPNEEHFISQIGPNFDFCVKTAILFAGLLPDLLDEMVIDLVVELRELGN